ncbi:MAG: glycosyltransferase family 1 protein [Candidatus Pacebacteria bacterium]|nr:glycosyltransferase family 1 protein [Candidatus Paceibacterota bacterium]
MKIGIDASRAFVSERTGTEEYSYQLIRHLAEIDTGGSEFVLYTKKGSDIDFELPDNFSLRELEGNFLWTQIVLSLEMLKKRIDVLFVPSHSIPFIHPRKTVLTVHGLEYKNCSECYSLKERFVIDFNVRVSLRWAKRIIVPSWGTKKDLQRIYGVAEEKIAVVHHGAEKEKSPVRGDDCDKESFDILFIGRLEKRKNVLGAVEAFDLFMKKIGGGANPDKSIRLVLAGKKGFGYEEIEKRISVSPYKNNIRVEGFVSTEKKQELYLSSSLFIFPSFCEGFGIPVLEAMGYGVPVLCSRIPSLAEVAGGAALLVDPANVEEIAHGIEKFYSDEDFKKKMIISGFDNLQKFDWKKCAKETFDMIKK